LCASFLSLTFHSGLIQAKETAIAALLQVGARNVISKWLAGKKIQHQAVNDLFPAFVGTVFGLRCRSKSTYGKTVKELKKAFLPILTVVGFCLLFPDVLAQSSAPAEPD
jgi:hypothetical protein